ncbi:MAG TPA: Gfo/Idh/MocA family oxidoreductase [Gemmataceae bacterium]|nr:Gfo/Idh/MocA family oxidoreductase [Gemmataceae bacterium]
MPINPPLNRKLRMGLVGGAGGFIGRVHTLAAQMDRRAVLVAGALSSDPDKARAAAADFDIAPERAYGSYQEMIERESRLPADRRIDFVTVATPNHTHYEIARAFVEAGLDVVCDKPMTVNPAEAEELVRLVRKSGVVFAVTHNYTGYPLVRQARQMVRGGELGEVQAVRVCYLQGSLRRQRTPEQQRRFAWKTDPARAGASGCFGDIGIHAYNLARFVTRLVPEEVSCLLESFERGPLDDYGTAVVRCRGGGQVVLTASRISHGRENDLRIEVDGTRAALAWRQEEPNHMSLRANGAPRRVLTRDPGAPWAAEATRGSCRLPAGHPEGFLEAFANVYAAAFRDMAVRASGSRVADSDGLYPGVLDGLEGVLFVERCVTSARERGAWQPMVRS